MTTSKMKKSQIKIKQNQNM